MQRFTKEIAKEKNIENKFSNPEFKATIEYHQKRCHNTEVTVYSHLIHMTEKKFPLPKIFFMKKFSENNPLKGYIIMEYLDKLKTVHIYENVTTGTVKQILRAIAVLEAMSLDFSLQEKDEFMDKPFTGICGAFFNKETLGNLMEILRTFIGHLSSKFDRLEKALLHLVDLEWADRLPEEIGMRPVLCHGDLWSMNILWRTNKDNLKIAAVIDFQTAHFGCPAFDLVRVMCACLSGKDRQEQWEELLDEFYGYLKEECGNRDMPYTLKQLKESYRRFFPLGGLMIMPMIGPLFDIICKSGDKEQNQKVILKVIHPGQRTNN
ncbi:unnamed protein product [Angiostrongylus costaricensis]|uniref:CHK domain-containing protein n=1 Tax=Angiostrongylus costaricensis TaxID=334426 RepID=A0A0R3PZX4_ANGCS|nr:unnamed protein product [Angiostrongylus costaricensis]